MATHNLKGKKNNNLKDQKRTRPSKVSAIINQKQLEQELKTTHEHLNHLLKSTSIAIYTCKASADYGATSITDNVKQITGYESREFVEHSSFWINHVHPEDRQRILNELPQIFEQGSYIHEYRFLNKDRTYKWIQDEMKLMRDRDGNPSEIMGYWIDITKHKQAEENLIESERKYRELADLLPEAVYEADENGKILFANRCAFETFGYTQEDFDKGLYLFEMVIPENRQKVLLNLQRLFKGENVIGNEYTALRKDGSTFPIFASVNLIVQNNKPIGVRGVVVDITEHKQAENALRSERNKFRGMLLSINDGVDIVNKDYIIEFQNEILQKQFGDKTGEKCYAVYMGLKEPCHFCSVQEAIKTGRATRVEFVGKDGRSYELNSSPFTDVDGNLKVIELVRDITERKQAEENLKESEEKYRLLVEESLQGIVISQGNPPRLVFANPSMTMILGYSFEELSSLSPEGIESLVHPEDRAFFFKNYKDRLEGKLVLPRYEIRGIRKDGSLVWLELSSTRIEYKGQPAVQAAFIDITERKQAEEALRESEERYRTILENIEDGYYEVDLPGNFTFFNDSLCRMLGYFREEMIGMGNQQYTDEENRKKLFQAFNEVYRTGKPIKGFGWEVFRKDGKKLFSEVSVSLIKDSKGQPIGFRGIARDITERKRAEEEIRQTLSLLNATLESTADGILVVDKVGKIESFNQKFVQMWRIPEPVIASKDDDQALAFVLDQLKDPEGFLGKVKKLYSQPTAESFDLLEFKDGRVFERYSQPQLIGEQSVGRVWSFRDVTDRKMAEGSLLTEKQRFQTLTENSPFGMAMIDLDGTFKYINPKFRELFGYDLTDIPDGKTWFRKAYPNTTYRHDVIETWINDLRSSKSGRKRSRIFTVICKDGTEKTINFIPVQLETGENLMACEDITERKQAEEALSESEERFRAMTVTAADAITVMDHQGCIAYWNPAAEGMFGYTPQEAIGKELHLLLAPERYHEAYQKGFEKFRNTGQGPAINNTIEFIALRKDGTEFPMEVSTSAFRLKGQWHAVGIIRDITERKRSEESLEKSEMRFMELFNEAPVGYFEYNVGGFITNVNRTYLEMLGYKFEEMIGQHVWKFIVEEEVARKQILEKLAGIMPPGRGVERTYRRRDGSLLPVLIEDRLLKNSAGKITGIRTTIQDITERKHAEGALRESEAKYRQLVEYAPIGIFEIDLNTLKFLNVNDVMCEVMGYSKEEFLSMSPLELLTEESRNLLAEGMEKMLSGEKTPDSAEVKLRTKDKSEFWALVNTKVFYKDGKPFKAQVVAQDISERKRLEEQLIQSQKMEAVGQLAGGIAHDFNNLLTVIKGYGQLSLLDLKESDPLWGNIQEIQKATQRASDLTRQLLAFSRRQILDLKVLNLNSLVRDLNKMLRRIIGEDIELITLFNEDLGRVKVDPGQIEQMILNLAVNARDAMPSGGKLIIETKNVEIDVEYVAAHMGLTPGGYVRLSVSDTGVGMSQEIMEKAFEPFFTTKEMGKGTGLGLATVYGIVKQSGGSVQVYSEPGFGTTFNIFLPRVEENLDALDLQEEPDLSPKGSETVLLVEDESSVRNLAYRILSQQGYTVLEAANGDEALRIVQEGFGKKIDLLLTDVVMPRMSGKELADRIKTLKPELKVLFTSGYTDDAIVHHGILTPGTHFLQKPFSPKVLSLKVREVLDR